MKKATGIIVSVAFFVLVFFAASKHTSSYKLQDCLNISQIKSVMGGRVFNPSL
jgi:hypothetical protein